MNGQLNRAVLLFSVSLYSHYSYVLRLTVLLGAQCGDAILFCAFRF
jgi:hypothetical protein